MKVKSFVAVCVVVAASAWAQQWKQSAGKEPAASVLEAKVRKAWEDFKNKDREAFAAIFTEDFREAEEDGNGLRDKKAEVAEVGELELAQYSLGDFTVKSIGKDSALVTYTAEYSGTAGGEALHAKGTWGEVWVKRGNGWKCLYVQETKVK